MEYLAAAAHKSTGPAKAEYERQLASFQRQYDSLSRKSESMVQKYNKNHDPKTGRFTFSEGGMGGGTTISDGNPLGSGGGGGKPKAPAYTETGLKLKNHIAKAFGVKFSSFFGQNPYSDTAHYRAMGVSQSKANKVAAGLKKDGWEGTVSTEMDGTTSLKKGGASVFIYNAAKKGKGDYAEYYASIEVQGPKKAKRTTIPYYD